MAEQTADDNDLTTRLYFIFPRISDAEVQSPIPPDHFTWGSRTYLMGILNITPDSFSGDGIIHNSEREGESTPASRAADITFCCCRAGATLFTAGADILDVGGESTRPGSQPVSEA
jgi:dihydropteroate synthase